MVELSLTENIIDNVKNESVTLLSQSMKDDLVKIILYGSCARGDYSNDSDIDIAVLVKCDNRIETETYNSILAGVATQMAMKYFAVVNFICIPYKEFIFKKEWYAYFKNIEMEGDVLYG
ncbi:MAG: nucleotidyltransferase domain-containing protein [Lachnospiraceae bacterium]|nr:nucleotidyltransferase domain-containing protein [Lachnospiraceae bacterium]